MAKPLKLDNSGNYYFRKEVPKKLQEAVGKTAIKFSLRTNVLRVAEIQVAELHRHWDSVFARLATARVEISHKDRLGLAGRYCEFYLKRFEDEPHTHSSMDAIINHMLSKNPRRRWGQDFTQRLRDKATRKHRLAFKTFLLADGVTLTEAEFDRTMKHVLDAIVIADERIAKLKAGIYADRSVAGLFPSVDISRLIVDSDGVRLDRNKYGTLNLFEKQVKERGFAASTVKRYRPIIQEVAGRLPDIRSITPEWCVEWKDELLASGSRSPRTVRQVYLAALSNLANFAVAQRSLTSNPLNGLYLKVPKRKTNRTHKGYTEEEARMVLGAALAALDETPTHQDAFARRWLPWLCCYTGARVGELAQLRKKDVALEEGVWVMEITPEAGTTKDSNARRVPLHPHLIAQGFVEALANVADGYLFCPEDGKRSPNTIADDLGRWVRELGIVDPELQPSHGWRHRFKTVSRRVFMEPAVRDYMQGHVPHNDAEGYGDQEAPVLLEWLSLIKWIRVDGDPTYQSRPQTEPQRPASPRLVWSSARLVN